MARLACEPGGDWLAPRRDKKARLQFTLGHSHRAGSTVSSCRRGRALENWVVMPRVTAG